MSDTSDTIYAAIGGHDTVVAVVDGLYERLTKDPLVRHHFAPERLPSLKAAQVGWFTAVLQGEDPPADLAKVHAHLHITDEQVAALSRHLDALLADAGLDRRLRKAVDNTVTRMWYSRQF